MQYWFVIVYSKGASVVLEFSRDAYLCVFMILRLEPRSKVRVSVRCLHFLLGDQNISLAIEYLIRSSLVSR